ncbi:MAG: hypothetical protein J6D52_09435, partial [Clostridia bacterium]|nr:hypothetical protein [Clostridia bacterium]
MTKSKSTKRALLASALALLVSVSMLVGTTFAWFTDSVTSSGNKIVAGTLDVELYMYNGTSYVDISDDTAPIFGGANSLMAQNNNADTLWEPGKTQVAYLMIKNAGNLALKYTVGLDVKNISKDLYKAMEYAVVAGAKASDVTKSTVLDYKSVNLGVQTVSEAELVMNPGTEHYFALAIHMDEEAGNEYQGGEVDFDLTVLATQATVEEDGFDNQYDVEADYVAEVKTADELATALRAGGLVKLANDISVTETLTVPAGVTVNLDLNGKTITGGYQTGSTSNHIYAIDNKGTLTLKNGTINSRGVNNYGTITLESGTINSIDGNGGYGVHNYAGASFVMNGGTIATTLEDDHQVDGGGYDATTLRVESGATFEMNGGVINNICDFTFAIDNYGTVAINAGKVSSVHTTVANYGTLTVNGGELVCNGVNGKTQHVIWASAGTTTINNGTFDGKDNYNGFNVDASAGATVTINGGSFLPVHSGSLYGQGTITVFGGTFANYVSDRVADGYIGTKNADGTY